MGLRDLFKRDTDTDERQTFAKAGFTEHEPESRGGGRLYQHLPPGYAEHVRKQAEQKRAGR